MFALTRARAPDAPSPPIPADAGSADARARLSRAIAIARIVAILGIVYVHAWTGQTGEALSALRYSPAGIARTLLIELFGRSAVPLLGMISGWLAAGSVVRRSYGGFLQGKARTILLPMLAWNAIAILLVCGAAYWGHLRAPVPSGLWWVVDELTALTRPNHINVQMPFLRDLFVCMVFAPVLARMPGWGLAAVMLAAAAWAVSGVALPLLLRPAILIFFAGGMLARRFDWVDAVARLPGWLAAAPFVLLVGPKAWIALHDIAWTDAHLTAIAAFDLLFRFASALMLWRMAWGLAMRGEGRVLERCERYGFLTFCAHLILMWLAGPAIGVWTGPLGSPAYLPLLVVQPLLVFGVVVLLGKSLEAVSPALAGMLSGGRLR